MSSSALSNPAQNGQVEMDPGWPGAPVEAVDDDLDVLAEVNHRPSRTTVLLIAGILAAVAFVGGAIVQKQYGGTSSNGQSTASGFPGQGGFPPGFSGGLPGGDQAGGAAVGGTGAGGAATGGGTTSGQKSATPVVVGTVTKLSGTSLTVKNLGGKSVNVTVPQGATITLVAGKSLTTLKIGATVSVAGTTAANGTVTATSITVRS